MTAPEPRTRAIVAELWTKFRPDILGRVTLLEQAADAQRVGTLDDQLRERAERTAHTLAGSLGSLDLGKQASTAVTEIARHLEFHFATGPRRKEREDAAELIRALRERLESLPWGSSDETRPDAAAADAERASLPTVLIVDSSEEFARQLAAEAGLRQIHALCCCDVPAARALAAENRVDIVLLDLPPNDQAEAALAFLGELTSGARPIPVLVLAATGGLASRIKVASLRGRGFLKKPIDASFVIEFAVETLRFVHDPASKVLVVDDDDVLFEPMRRLLEPHGIQFSALSDPRKFWEVLEAERPDLLVLDVDMPHVRGIELCRVLRNDRRWNTLPVLFLAAPADSETLLQMFAAGADDYVSKPMIGPEFVTRIKNRLERSRLLRTMAEVDPLTGTSTRLRAVQVLEDHLRMADRYNQPVCLTIVDLDHFKVINDRHGHAVGDQVLAQFGRLLVSSFRGEDMVARWGGEEFLVTMYGMHLENAAQRMNSILDQFRKIVFSDDEKSEFGVTFSAGISEYPTHGVGLQALYRVADSALYAAKAGGRARVIAADRPHGSPLSSRGAK